MKIDFKEISISWFNKLVHTKELKNLADKRFDICLSCEYKKEIIEGKEWSLKCGKCGCPLKGKVYTPNTHLDKEGSCPLDKWKDIEIEYLKNHKLKNNRTIL